MVTTSSLFLQQNLNAIFDLKMALPSVEVKCNWNQIGDCELSPSIQCKVNRRGLFIRPKLEEIVEKERVVLQRHDNLKEACELLIKLQPSPYKIESIAIVSTAAKLELYLGPQNECSNACHTEALEDIDEDTASKFRHDIQIRKWDGTELMLKMLPASDEIHIFGTILQIAHNPNYIDLSKFWWYKFARDELLEPEYLTKTEATVLFHEKIKQVRDNGNNPSSKKNDMDVSSENNENVTAQVTCNWKRIAGCEFSQHVRCTKAACLYIPPEFEDVIENENAILLEHDDMKEPCEIYIKLQPSTYYILTISIVSTVKKIEAFLDPLTEDKHHFFSNSLEDSKNIIFTYQHDLSVIKSGVSEFKLKLFPSSNEICIFATVLQILPNPKLIRKEREAYISSLENYAHDMANKNHGNSTKAILAPPAPEPVLKPYLENGLEKLERKINDRLDIAIAAQNAKLDEILDKLENGSTTHTRCPKSRNTKSRKTKSQKA